MIKGKLLIGSAARRGSHGELWGIEAATGKRLKSRFGGASLQDVDQACELADAAFDAYHAAALEQRAVFLETIAHNSRRRR